MKPRVLLGTFVAITFAFYCAFIPLHVQGGDTAELVNSAFHRLVAHPPGYPLFQWLQYTWTHTYPFSTVFWRAGLLNTLLAIGSLLILGLSGKFSIWGLLLLVVLATTPEFIEAAVLPDVFALHSIFLAAFAACFLFMEPRRGAIWGCLLLAGSMANHHTTVLLLPCFIHLLYEAQRNDNPDVFIASGIGGLLTFGLYLSLFFLKNDHPLSWGNIEDLSSLISHFLRQDYGTFQLAVGPQGVGIRPFIYLLHSTWPILILTVACLYAAWKLDPQCLKSSRVKVWTACIGAVFSFSLILNVDTDPAGKEVLRRFHVMPVMMLVTLNLYLISHTRVFGKIRTILALSFLPVLTINVIHFPDYFGLRHDSTIEDHGRNLLNTAQSHAPAIIVTDNDSAYFAMRYLQSFESEDAEVAVITMPLLFHSWYQRKVNQLVPQFRLSAPERISSSRYMNQDQDVILPNLQKIRFFFTKDYKDGEKYKVTFFSLGRMLSTGHGVVFEESKITKGPPPELRQSGPQQFTKLRLYYEYSHFQLAKAYQHATEGKDEKALRSWEQALREVPYCYPAMVNLCERNPIQREYCGKLDFWESATKNLF